MEELQKDRDKWNQECLKRLDFINKRLRDKKEARDYIGNLDSAMLEYYRVFGVKLNHYHRTLNCQIITMLQISKNQVSCYL